MPTTTTPVPTNPPRRTRLAIWLPLGVGLAVVALLFYTGGRALMPVAEVRVRPALFDPSASMEPAAAGASEPTVRAVQAPGWLEAAPFATACTALTDGIIAEVMVLEGDRVETGQVVATLVRRDAELSLDRARAELGAAQAALETARADLAAARTTWENPVERTRAVEVARAAVAQTEAQLAQLPSLIAAEVAAAREVHEELDRVRTAYEAGAANEIEVVLLEQRLERANATAESLERRGPILRAELQRAVAELVAAERQAELRTDERRSLDTASADVARAEAAVAQQQSAVDEAALRVERTEIKAPRGGVVQRRLKSPGDKITLGSDDPMSAQVLHLYDPAELQVRVDVPLADASQVSAGQVCEIVVEVLPDRTFQGEVTRVAHQADLQKNTLQVKVRVVDPAPMLRPDMLTRVKFFGSGQSAGRTDSPAAPGVVLVPEDAVLGEGGAATVMVVRDRRADRGTARVVSVRVLGRAEGWATVSGEIRPGDLIVTEPGSVRDGQGVRVREEAGS
jgi:HlyD family secretion protein